VDVAVLRVGRAGRSIRTVTSSADDVRRAEALPRPAVWAAYIVFVVFVAIGAAGLNPNPPVALAAALVAAGVGALLVTRPRGPLLVCAAVATGGIAVLGNGESSDVGWFAVCLLSGWCVLVGSRRDGLVYWAAAMALFGAQWLWVDWDAGWGAWMAGTTLTALAALVIRHELDLVAQLRAAQADLAAHARAEERNRIARELHDIIAHSLTVSLLHITSARLAVEHDPGEAAHALAEAERLGRESLDEVRSTVGLLRQDGDVGNSRTTPLPGADEVPALVERFRSAGADITLMVDGDMDRLPATTGLALYRILQEALINAIKHAPGSSTLVRLTVQAGSVNLAVESDGPPGEGAGFGVLSMRERAEAVGGGCTAGPGGRGWLVQAELPLSAVRREAGAT